MWKVGGAHDRHAVEAYCICRKPSRGFMVECDHCNEWYHGSCVNILEEEVHDDTEFVCVVCSETKKSELVYPLKSLRVKCSKARSGHTEDWADPQVPAFLQPTYCVCAGRDDGRAMLLCGICQEWYHAPCVGLTSFVDMLLPHKRDNPDLLPHIEQLMIAHAFVCSRCSGTDHQIMDEVQFLSVYEKLPTRILCKEKPKQHSRAKSIIPSLCSREIVGKQHGRMRSTLNNTRWSKLQTLKMLDVAAWSNVAPWVVRASPKSPVVAVGTNLGTVELFSTSLSSDESATTGKRSLNGTELQGLGVEVANQHLRVVHTELDDISALEWSADASMLAASSWFVGSISLCDVERGQPVSVYTPHRELVRSLHMPRDMPHMLISASHDKTVSVRDIRGMDCFSLDGHAGRAVGAQSIWPYVITAASDSTIRVWDVRNRDKCLSISCTPSPITSLDISPDGKRVCVNTVPGSVLLFDTTDLLYSCQSDTGQVHYWELLGHVNKFWCVGRAYFSPDGTAIATGSEDSCTVVWNIAGSTPQPSVAYRSKTNTHWVWDVAWVHSNTDLISPMLVTCSEDRTIAMLGTDSIFPDYQSRHSKLSIGAHVLARWHDLRYYHAVTDGEIGGMYQVRFRGWHGPDSRALYEPASLLYDNTQCACKKGHFAGDIPTSCISLLSPHAPPPPLVAGSPYSSSSSPDTPARKRLRRNNTPIVTLSPFISSSQPLSSSSPSFSTPTLLSPSTPLSASSPEGFTIEHSSSATTTPSLVDSPSATPQRPSSPHFPNTARRLSFVDIEN